MIAAIYARKSTEQTGVSEDQKSVSRQIERATDYAKRKGWHVAEEHVYSDDGISGAEFAKRPGFIRLMNALKPRPSFQVLIMSEESRLEDDAVKPNPALATILHNTPNTNSSHTTSGHAGTAAYNTSPATVGLPLHPLELIPRSSMKVFTYAGRLTTPQCSEGVLWFVLSEPLKVPSSQITGLQNFYTGNNRIIQNTNNVSSDGEASTFQRTVEIHHNFHAQP